MKKYYVLHNTNKQTLTYLCFYGKGCYPGNRIIKVKMENKVARGFPSNIYSAQNLMWVYL
jgi:hypothetical protein